MIEQIILYINDKEKRQYFERYISRFTQKFLNGKKNKKFQESAFQVFAEYFSMEERDKQVLAILLFLCNTFSQIKKLNDGQYSELSIPLEQFVSKLVVLQEKHKTILGGGQNSNRTKVLSKMILVSNVRLGRVLKDIYPGEKMCGSLEVLI